MSWVDAFVKTITVRFANVTNRQTEIDLGMKKAPTEIEKIADELVTLANAINIMKNRGQSPSSPNYAMHTAELAKNEKKLNALRDAGNGEAVSVALLAASRKIEANQAEMEAVTSAWSRQNPGKTNMEYGGAETQKLFDQVAALPPSASIQRADKFTCDYCSKSSTEKLNICSRCRNVAYCNAECQKAAWAGHKKVCKRVPAAAAEEEDKVKLPLTWEQLEVFGGNNVAKGKVRACTSIILLISQHNFF